MRATNRVGATLAIGLGLCLFVFALITCVSVWIAGPPEIVQLSGKDVLWDSEFSEFSIGEPLSRDQVRNVFSEDPPTSTELVDQVVKVRGMFFYGNEFAVWMGTWKGGELIDLRLISKGKEEVKRSPSTRSGT